MLFTCVDCFSLSGIVMFEMVSVLFFLSIIADNFLSVSSPIIPSNDFSPGNIKNSIVSLIPILLKNFPLTFSLMLIVPAADLTLNGVLAG